MIFNDKLAHVLSYVESGASIDLIHAEVLIQFIGESPEVFEEVRQALIQAGVSEKDAERIRQSDDVNFAFTHVDAALMENGHPVRFFYEENISIKEFMEGPFQKAVDLYEKNPALGQKSIYYALEKLSNIQNHYMRKEYLLFPLIETEARRDAIRDMKELDNRILNMIAELLQKINTDKPTVVIKKLDYLVSKVHDMIIMEGTLMAPLLNATLVDVDWTAIAQQLKNFDTSFLNSREGGTQHDFIGWLNKKELVPSELEPLSAEFPESHWQALVNAFPGDVTFINRYGYIQVMNDRPHMCYLKGCMVSAQNPEDAVNKKLDVLVEEPIIQDLRSGRKKKAVFWHEEDGRFFLIFLIGVFDAHGEYMGILELTQDITSWRELHGEYRAPHMEKQHG